jgi:protein ImuB
VRADGRSIASDASDASDGEHFHSAGFVGLRLSVPLYERLGDEQGRLLGEEEYAGQRELDHLIERLRARLGEGAVVQPALVESHVPERACVVKRQGDKEARRQGDRRKRGRPSHGLPASVSPCPSAARPLCLLIRPQEVRVVVRPSDDSDGQPAQFIRGGRTHKVVHAVGPERIAGRWWDGHDKTRDYFDVSDEAGRRFWVFRVRENGRWFLHGEFK